MPADDEDSSNNAASSDLRIINQAKQDARMAFWRIAQDGLFRLVEDAPPAWNGPDARWYRTERAMVSHHVVEPFCWGACVTIFLFGTFRISGSQWYARLRHSNFTFVSASKSPVKRETDVWNNSPTSTNIHRHPLHNANTNNISSVVERKSYLDQKAEQQKQLHSEAFQLPLDLLVSVLCGISSVLWLIQPQAARKALAEAPLLAGKSVVADSVCTAELEAAFQRHIVDQHVLTPEIIHQDESLHSFAALVQNCRIRSDFLRSQREKSSAKFPDVVPYPGLEGVRR